MLPLQRLPGGRIHTGGRGRDRGSLTSDVRPGRRSLFSFLIRSDPDKVSPQFASDFQISGSAGTKVNTLIRVNFN